MDALERFLRTDPRDVGCDRVMAFLHVYVDLTAAGRERWAELDNWISILMVTVPIFFVFQRRMHVEEDALLAGLGEPYRSYMQRTRRLIPGIY